MAAVLSVAFLGEKLAPLQIVGIAIVIIALVGSTVLRSRVHHRTGLADRALVQLRSAVWTGDTRGTRPIPDVSRFDSWMAHTAATEVN